MLPCLIAKTLSSTNWWTHFAALTGYRQSGKYWMKRLNPPLIMNLKKEKTNKVSFDSSLVSLWFHLSPLWFHFWVKPNETIWNRINIINCCQMKGLCKLQSPFSLKPTDFLNLRALLNLLQSSIWRCLLQITPPNTVSVRPCDARLPAGLPRTALLISPCPFPCAKRSRVPAGG